MGVGCSVLFLIGNVCFYEHEIVFWEAGKNFIFELMTCTAVILLLAYCSQNNRQFRILEVAAKYTMPVFLMHTIFDSPCRSVLLKIRITSAEIHIAADLAVIFVCPIDAVILGIFPISNQSFETKKK